MKLIFTIIQVVNLRCFLLTDCSWSITKTTNWIRKTIYNLIAEKITEASLSLSLSRKQNFIISPISNLPRSIAQCRHWSSTIVFPSFRAEVVDISKCLKQTSTARALKIFWGKPTFVLQFQRQVFRLKYLISICKILQYIYLICKALKIADSGTSLGTRKVWSKIL